ncbi:MAG: FHA domain-containing protein [Magnetococcales bacterium]|nr:FHA domain-containing protein [Magnetococcales bacterium]MBF0150065.1 FHA domain-containing protein [Magnetococcales bacterium]
MTVDGEDATILVGRSAGETGDESAKVPKARLVCLDDALLDSKQKGLVIVLHEGVHTLGRKADNTDPILYQGVSSYHARILPMQGKWVIEDLGSTNGIWIKGVRERKAFLIPGDFIKIGAIPFQFLLDDPSCDVQLLTGQNQKDDDDGGGGTMYLTSDEGKADKIVASLTVAQEEKKVEAKQREAAIKSGKSISASVNLPVQKKNSSSMIILFVLAVVLIGGGYGVYTMKLSGEGDAVLRYQKELKKFTESYEVVKGAPSDEDLKKQSAQLEEPLQTLSAEVNRDPDNLALKELFVRFRFFHLERQLTLLARAGQMQQADALVADLLNFISVEMTRTANHGEWFKDMQDLMGLVQDIVVVKQFRQHYPRPSKEAVTRPDLKSVALLTEVSKRIVGMKKEARINILFVQFPLFGHLVTEVDEDDLPMINQWRELLQ